MVKLLLILILQLGNYSPLIGQQPGDLTDGDRRDKDSQLTQQRVKQ